MVNGGSLTQIVHNLVHLYEKIFTLIKLLLIGGGPVATAFALLKGLTFLLHAIDKVMLPLCILYPFTVFYWVIGISMIYVGLVLLMMVLDGFYATLPRRIQRREYAYA
jgi:hypothetical protein